MSTVTVKNIASEKTTEDIRDFFSFCGKISDVQVTKEADTQTATITFEKQVASNTALLLNGTSFGPNQITVTSASSNTDEDASHFTSNADRDTDEITQEEKPRSRIFAEYLAHGYVIGDAALNQAIELDNKHGVSNRFFKTLQNLDQKYHATEQVKATDQSYGITQRIGNLFGGLNSYFESATNTATGKKVVQFYSGTSKQAQDIHAEARRLADLKKEEHGGSAYKAAGLEKVFGKEAAKDASSKDGANPTTIPQTTQPVGDPSTTTTAQLKTGQ